MTIGRRRSGSFRRRLFRDGGNELTAYLVEGPVGAETLRPIDVAEAD